MTVAVVVLLLLIALVFGFLIESLRADQFTLSFVVADLPVSDTELAHNHERLVRDCTILALLIVAVAVLWLIWQYRAHANLRAILRGTRFSPAWGVASWLIPGVNLLLPPLAMRELWRAGNPDVDDWRRSRTSPLLWLWWMLVLAGIALAVFALTPVWGKNASPTDLNLRDQRAVIAAAVGLMASLAAALLFGLLQGRIRLKEDRVRLGTWRGWSDR
jgi:Domain of unknown function (DUF4328)